MLLNSNEKPEYLPQDESVIVCLNQNDEMMKFSPITLSSYILRYFRQLVQDYIKKKPIKDLHGKLVHSIESVIIGIPVNFPQSGKQATIKAARLAGFKHVSMQTCVYQYLNIGLSCLCKFTPSLAHFCSYI